MADHDAYPLPLRHVPLLAVPAEVIKAWLDEQDLAGARVLALFLLEMGVVAGRRVGDLRKAGLFLLGFGVLVPLVNGTIGVFLGKAAGLELGGATLLGVLSASASYIAAPAAIRISLPDANPTLYLTSSLAITFPFNITRGIPIYLELARTLYR